MRTTTWLRRAVAAVLLLSTLVGVGCAPADAGPIPPRPLVQFTVLPADWTHSLDADDCTALSWRYRPSPTGWAGTGAFVGDRAAISATVIGNSCASPATPVRGYRTLRRPAQLGHPDAIGMLEGSPTSVQYRFTRTIAEGCTLDLRVSFARPPSRRSRLVAQRVLDGIRVGDLRGTSSC